jgi:dephospho-CoA kinase
VTQHPISIVGLTGGIGSGKSVVAAAFARRGVAVLHADELGHAALAKGGGAEEAAVALLGAKIVGEDGIIDRSKVAECVFDAPDLLLQLNEMVHPVVGGAIQDAAAAFSQAGHELVLVEAALWGDSGTLPPWMDALLLVVCPEEERLRRLLVHREMREEDARLRMQRQVVPESKVPLATWVIENSGSVEALEQRVDELLEVMHGYARRK